MARERGNATVSRVLALGLALFCFLVFGQVAEATTYIVGDSKGWSFNAASWAQGKHFHAGDVLVFKYNPSFHNVVAVNAAGYNACTTPRGSRTYTSGNDRIRLARGANYFICSMPGHCQSGMKFEVVAA